MVNFISGPAIVWLPKIFFWSIFAAAVFIYWNRERAADYLRKFSKQLIKIAAGFYVLYAAFLTWGQYYVWSQNSLGRIFLVSDRFGALDGSSGYFLFYSYGRFWLNPTIAILSAFLFYALLKSLKKYRERFFEEGETELGFLCALAAGWPQIVIFLPLVFSGVVLVSSARLVVFRERFTTLGWPFLVALFITFLFGKALIEALNLKVLYI